MTRAVKLALVSLVAITIVVLGSSKPEAAQAHPLGQFSINRLALIDLRPDGVSLRYVLDLSEIPSVPELEAADKNGDGDLSRAESDAYLELRAPAVMSNLELTLNGAAVALQPIGRSIDTPTGQGGLDTLRLVFDFAATLPEPASQPFTATFRDTNYADRFGWRSVIVRAGSGVGLTDTSVAAEDVTHELMVYPDELLKNPPTVSQARFSFQLGVASTATPPPPAPVKATQPTAAGKTDRFSNLISAEHLSPAVIALSLFIAMVWGAAHALGPGHGKTIVAAYLVGARGTARHAVVLGLTVTATHTSTVVLLGLVTLYASRYFAAEDLYFWLNIASGVMVVLLGGFLFTSRLGRLLRPSLSGVHAHDHNGMPHESAGPAHHAVHRSLTRAQVLDHSHNSDEDALAHARSHLPKVDGWRGLVLLGISGGLLPCPTALVVMLGAIALDRVVYGLVLVGAFSLGLAGVLTGIGLLLVWAKAALDSSNRLAGLARSPLVSRSLQVAPILSAFIILIAGLILTTRALTLA